jgi:hypothetical protein
LCTSNQREKYADWKGKYKWEVCSKVSFVR